MLISPPFLPKRNAGETDSDWLDRAMSTLNDGAFPVGKNCCWHGGLHLQAPQDGNGQEHLPVRAIADGKVRFVRQGTPMPEDAAAREAHALGYEGWTSDGVVVIEHETDIGAAADGTAVTVRYYAIYQHLTEIPAHIATHRRIYRKESIGEAGYIAGRPNRIHFEIVCDDANLQNLIGRTTGELNTDTDGRRDAVFGELYFRLPVGTPIYSPPAGRRMHHASAAAQTVLANAASNTANPPQAIAPVGVSSERCYIGLRYAHGEGEANHRGDLTITTYRENGSVCGAPVVVPNGEYDLYKNAKTISESYLAGGRPAPSAVYELLRFGRIVNTTNETLTPANVPHWRQAVLPTAAGEITGWINLNANDIRKFSDADFPHWRGWKIHDDDHAPKDNRCDSAGLKAELDENGDRVVTPTELASRMQVPAVRKKMHKAICSIPTEWNAASVEDGWSWLKTRTEENPEPVTDEGFSALCKHHKALCFNGGAIFNATRHFHPRGFIEAFRKCGWLSTTEMAQCIPRNSLSAQNLSWDTALARATTHQLELNKYFRKFLGSSRQRVVHSLAQIFIETGMLRTLSEGGTGNGKAYGAMYGRGYMQLTWAGNYKGYGEYKAISNHTGAYSDQRITATSLHAISDGGAAITWSPRYDPNLVSTNLNHAAESSGWFWITKNFRGTNNINRATDLATTPTTVSFINWLINGGGNGYAHRHQFAKFLTNVLLDDNLLAGKTIFTYPPLTPLVNLGNTQNPNWTPRLCTTFPPTEVQYSLSENIDYEYQRP